MHSHLSSVYGSAVTDRSTVGCWVKRMMASETGEAELHGLPCYPNTAISPEVLHSAGAISLEG
jgi:hypothetical protein